MKNYIFKLLILLFVLIPREMLALNTLSPIAVACQKGHWNDIEDLIGMSNPSKITLADIALCSNKALEDGQSGLFSFFISLKPNAIQYITSKSMRIAVLQGQLETIKNVIEHGFDVSSIKKGENFLHFAARSQKNTPEIMDIFLLEGLTTTRKSLIHVDQRSKILGTTALGEALKHGQYASAKLLLDASASLIEAIYVSPAQGPKWFLESSNNQVPFIKAWLVKYGYKEVRRLLKHDGYSSLQKKQFIRFLSHELPDAQQKVLKKIWNQYENHMLEIMLENIERADEDSPVQEKRSICLSICDDKDQKDFVNLAYCSHHICRDCAHEFIGHATHDKSTALTCPAKGCKRALDMEKIASIGIDSQTIVDLTIRTNEKTLHEHPSFTHCHQPDCPGGAFNPKKKDHITCFVCGHFHCTTCGVAHPKMGCNEHLNKQFMEHQMAQNIIKKCPNCKVIIEKNQGCDHMTCKKCKYEFYWTTLKKYKR